MKGKERGALIFPFPFSFSPQLSSGTRRAKMCIWRVYRAVIASLWGDAHGLYACSPSLFVPSYICSSRRGLN